MTGVAVSVALLATALVAGAETTSTAASTTTTSTVTVTSPAPQMSVMINAQGRGTLRGTVDAISAGSLLLKTWGGDWTVNIASGTQVLPTSMGGSLSQLKVGDVVTVEGMAVGGANLTLNATKIHSLTLRMTVKNEEKQNREGAKDIMKGAMPRNFAGVVSNVAANAFTLTSDGVSYLVNLATNAEVVTRNWITLPFTSIQNNDNIRIWGVNASGTITAQIVHDLSR